MNAAERARFEMLRAGSWTSPQYVTEYYGLRWPLQDDLKRHFMARANPDACTDAGLNRWRLESFFQLMGILPVKWAAAQMGMTETSLQSVLRRSDEIGLLKAGLFVYPGGQPSVVHVELLTNMETVIPGIRFRTFGSYDSYCELLHSSLRDTFQVEIQPLYCATSEAMRDDYRAFARHFDCITLNGLSVRHEVWLDFRKPMSLPMDRVSKLLYAQNQAELAPFHPGAAQPELASYAAVASGATHA